MDEIEADQENVSAETRSRGKALLASPPLRPLDHLPNPSRQIDRSQVDLGMRGGEYAKHLIGNGLTDRVDLGEVEGHGLESVHAIEQSSCL